ncbi:MAG: class II fructose-bisphosphate aldolase [Candidatus Hodarchaeales archaeon]|jgi:fructose-bisphosphate aldolase class II
MVEFSPMLGKEFFQKLHDKEAIILATNTRICIGIVDGIFKAAKDTSSPIIFELARSECDLVAHDRDQPEKGYTGLTPADFATKIKEAAARVGYSKYLLHADHITIKKSTPEEIQSTKELITEQVKNGYTSFAIDASFLFNPGGKTEKEQLAKNVEITTEIARHIEKQIGHDKYGLEVEVGEIGKKDPETGLVMTTKEEAVTFIEELNANGVYPQVLAIANGSVHGFSYDAAGNPLEQVGIDISRTIEIAQAVAKHGVRIAQHGITGTPMEIITTKFPKGMIGKGNVGTLWMTTAWDTLKVYEPELYQKIYDWTIKTYGKPGKPEKETFMTKSKIAIKQFFDEIYSVSPETVRTLEAKAYAEALLFLRAFNSTGKADFL